MTPTPEAAGRHGGIILFVACSTEPLVLPPDEVGLSLPHPLLTDGRGDSEKLSPFWSGDYLLETSGLLQSWGLGVRYD